MYMQWSNIGQYNWPKENEKQQLKKLANRCGVMLIVLLGFMYLISLGFGFLNTADFLPQSIRKLQEDATLWEAVQNLVLNLLFYVVAVPLLLWYANRQSNTQVSEYLSFPNMSGKEFWKWVLMGVGVVYTASVTGNIFYSSINYLLGLIGIPMQSPDVSVSPDIASIMVFTLGVTILAPFFEELLVRCGLVGTLRGYGFRFTAIATGILFGFMHTSFEQVFFAAMMGIYAGFVAAKYRSVWPTIVLHMIINGISNAQAILLSFLDVDLENMMQEFEAGNFSAIRSLTPEELLGQFGVLTGIMLLSGLLMTLGIIGMVKLVKEASQNPAAFRDRPTGSLLTLKEKCITFFQAPGVVVFLIISVCLSLLNAYSYLMY
ncbi:MAG: type II CAAX endopeptidase family protein [Clostridiales bacterium]|nr:type II CAAX endopeptidase family protein [Clostridiales bacterium]